MRDIMSVDFEERYRKLMKIYVSDDIVSAKEYDIADEQIIELFRKFLDKEVESDFKKDKIVALLENFSPIFDRHAADAVNCGVG